MEEPMYPTASKDIAKKREELAPEIQRLSEPSVISLCRWCAALQNKRTYCGCGGPRDPVPLLHSQPYQERTIERCQPGMEIMEAIWVAAEMRLEAQSHTPRSLSR